MTDIDAIMELALVMEPGSSFKPQFSLWSDTKGRWHAKVTMDRYYALVEDKDTPEEALSTLRADLVRSNQGFVRRMTDTLKRWTGSGTPTLRLIKKA
jgi:hypothetical protein